MRFNNKRNSPSAPHGAPEFTQDVAEVDNGAEILYMEENRKRYSGVPATAYDLKKQLEEGVPLEKSGTYMTLEKTHGADIATRTVKELQSRIDDARVKAEMKRLREESDKAFRASVIDVQPSPTPQGS